jgi:hypothetical protein
MDRMKCWVTTFAWLSVMTACCSPAESAASEDWTHLDDSAAPTGVFRDVAALRHKPAALRGAITVPTSVARSQRHTLRHTYLRTRRYHSSIRFLFGDGLIDCHHYVTDPPDPGDPTDPTVDQLPPDIRRTDYEDWRSSDAPLPAGLVLDWHLVELRDAGIEPSSGSIPVPADGQTEIRITGTVLQRAAEFARPLTLRLQLRDSSTTPPVDLTLEPDLIQEAVAR